MCEELEALRGSKFDMHSRMIYFRKKLMENEWLGKKLFRKKSSTMDDKLGINYILLL